MYFVMYIVQFSGVIQNIENHCAIRAKFKINKYINVYSINRSQNGTTIFNILDSTTELCMTRYIIGVIFSSGGATLYKNSSYQTMIVIHNKIFLPPGGATLYKNPSDQTVI